MKLWLIGTGMFIAGFVVYTLFGMQILITKKCAMKLYRAMCNDYEFWYPESCKSYLTGVRRRNTILLLIVSAVVVVFVPLAGVIGFLLGLLFARIVGGGKAGLTDDNVKETLSIFLRFVKPEKSDEFADLFMDVVLMVRANSMLGFS